MTQDAELDLLEDASGVDLSLNRERRTRIIVALVTCAFAAVVVLAMISESRLKIEQRLQLLGSSHSHP
jgi:hypothetical protein